MTHHITIVVTLAGEPFAEEGGSSEAHEKVSVDNQVIKSGKPKHKSCLFLFSGRQAQPVPSQTQCDFKTSAKLRLTTHKESVHEVTQFVVRYATEEIKNTYANVEYLHEGTKFPSRVCDF